MIGRYLENIFDPAVHPREYKAHYRKGHLRVKVPLWKRLLGRGMDPPRRTSLHGEVYRRPPLVGLGGERAVDRGFYSGPLGQPFIHIDEARPLVGPTIQEMIDNGHLMPPRPYAPGLVTGHYASGEQWIAPDPNVADNPVRDALTSSTSPGIDDTPYHAGSSSSDGGSCDGGGGGGD